MQDRKQFILSADIKTVMWQSSWPAVVAIVLYGLNNFLDALLVGHLIGPESLAAVGLAYPLSQIVMGFARLTGTGGSAALSIWLGAKQDDKLHDLFGSLNILCLLSTLLFSLPAYIFAEQLLQVLGAKGSLTLISAQYFRASLIGSFFWIHGFSVNMLIRGEGKMKTAAWMIGIGLLIDILLKPVFIAVFNWGVAGAAWATNVGMVIYSILGISYFAQKNNPLKWYSLRFNASVFREIITLGFPEMLFSVMSVIQSIVILNALGKYGSTTDLVFYTVVNRFYLFLLTPLFGLMRGLQPVAGINFGAGNHLRARKSFYISILAGLLLVVPFWLFSLLWPENLLLLILPGLQFSSFYFQNLSIYLSVLPLLPLIVMALAYLPAINQAQKASQLAIFRQLVFYLPAMIILPPIFGVSSIFWGSACIEILVAGLTVILLKNGLGPGENKFINIQKRGLLKV